MSTLRSRSQSTTMYIGTQTRDPHPPITTSLNRYEEFCNDTIGDYGNDHPLSLRKYDRIPFTMDGGPDPGKQLTNWFQYSISPSHLGSGFDSSALATLLIARTNPSRPAVQLPVFVAEMRDFPRLVRLAGRTLLQKGASANLSYHFGWKPLISDLLKMFNFQATVAKRVTELERLYQKGGIKRRMSLTETTVTETGSETTILSNPWYARTKGIPTTSTVRRSWGTCRWVPNGTSYPRTHMQRVNAARKYALGLHPSQITQNVWEALPWSWLVDWFGNVGSFLQASNNSIAKTHGRINIMITTETTRTYKVTSKPAWATLSPSTPEQKTIYKSRDLQSGPSLSAHVPFLTGRQLSILGSLAILRSRR